MGVIADTTSPTTNTAYLKFGIAALFGIAGTIIMLTGNVLVGSILVGDALNSAVTANGLLKAADAPSGTVTSIIGILRGLITKKP